VHFASPPKRRCALRDAMASAGRALTRGLSSALIGVEPTGQHDAPPAPEGEGEPLTRQDTAAANRDRVEENRRILAAQMLTYSLPLMILVAVVILMLLVASVAIYVEGWLVMSRYSTKPCDVPLRWWLLVMLLLPLLQCNCNHLLNLCSQAPQDQPPKRLQAFVAPIAIAAGAWMVADSKTCHTSAPELYGYAKMYLICQAVVWVLSFIVSCCIVSLIFWMHRQGLLDTGPGPAFAARPGLINEIETVAFSAADFAAECSDSDMETPECAICVQPFEEGEMVKKTPCGHYFGEECLGEWLTRYAKTCPLCRKDLQQALDEASAGAGGGGGP